MNAPDDKKTFNLRDTWRKRAAMDPDWAADQIYKGFQEDIRLQEEIKQLRAGIIEKGDDLIDQIQQWVIEGYRVEINRSYYDGMPGDGPRFDVRFYDHLGRTPGWTTGSAHEVREAVRWAISGLKTLAERDPKLAAEIAAVDARARGRKLEGS